jgi:hypothetical protein
MANWLSKVWGKIKSGASKVKSWVVDKWDKTPSLIKYTFTPYAIYKGTKAVSNGVKKYIDNKKLQSEQQQDNSIRGIATKEYGGVPVWLWGVVGVGAGFLILK